MVLLASAGLGLFSLALPASASDGLTLHVATNGHDRWSGRLPAPNAAHTDGPLATPAEAVRQARAARSRPEATGPVTVLFRSGRHELAAPLVLTPEDSGSDAETPFTLAAFPGEHPVLSGGRRLTGWQPAPGRPGVWQARVPGDGPGRWRFRCLFVDGRRAVRARTPNEGSYFRMAGARVSDKPAAFHFRPGDLRPAWAGGDVEVVALEKWTDIRQHLQSIDAETRLATLSGSSTEHTREADARYWVENTMEALDAPGEWHLDAPSGTVFYLPHPGEDMARAEVIAPVLEELVRLQGDPATRRPVRHVVLRGLGFRHTDWAMGREGFRDPQAAVGFAGDLRAEWAVDCVVEECTFGGLAGYAVDFGRGCQRNRIVGNEMADLGAGGVRLGETARRTDPFDACHANTITDNHIHEAGRIFPPAVGVLILQAATNRVAHNHIHDLYYTAISVGWTWGYQASPCHDNVIEFNHLHHLGHGRLSDMGGIYTLGPQPGTILRHNLIHDVTSHSYGGWGLYTDEGSTGMVLEDNVVYRCKSAGFHQHYGRENVVRNNVFAFNREHQVMRSRDEEHVSFYFTNNLVVFEAGSLLGSRWKNDRFVMEDNLYWDTRLGTNTAAWRFSGATLEEWRGRGHDRRSRFADPLFTDPAGGDFTLRPDSPALALGFRPIRLDTVGVRPPGRRQP